MKTFYLLVIISLLLPLFRTQIILNRKQTRLQNAAGNFTMDN